MRVSFFTHTFLLLLLLLLLLLSVVLSSALGTSLSYATSRRILHQPFFPQDSSPSPPPSSEITPGKSPFFPTYPSPPAFPTFTPNISSLILPQSPNPKRNTRNILAASLSVTLSSLLLLGIFVLLHRRRRSNDRDPSDTSKPGPKQHMLKTTSASSEFLYLDTLVNSHNLKGQNRNSPTNAGSPEIRPLPPLNPRRIYHDGDTTPTGDDDDDDNEEFYSPRVSLGSRESSTPATGSSGLSSDSGSPGRPNSPSISPPVSLSPPPKNAEQNKPPPSSLSSSSPVSSSPERGLKPFTVTPPPPPPPPPPRLTGQPIVSKPTPLIPNSRPFLLQSKIMSPIELGPPSSLTMEEESVEENTPKPKLKPLHWDKVPATSDREMVWDHLRSSSFQLNEEMIETLFVVNTSTPKPKQQASQLRQLVLPMPNQENRILDPKKAQNIAILLRAFNVTIEEVCEALLEGNADTLGAELLESLMKMAPTKEEERKLKDYKDDSPTKLGHAEKFLKAVLDVPFAFKRVEALLYLANFETEVEYLKKSFETLEVACEELRNSRMFLKLLEAVLKTGNRMNVGTNRGDAHAFKLDTLLKLVDIKGADGKTTLLHFVVQEIIRTEGARISGANQNPNSTASEDAKCRKLGLQVVSGLCSELASVKKAAGMDSEILSSEVSKLSRGLQDIGEVVRLNETLVSDESSQKFSESMKRFVRMAEEEIIKIQAQESVALSLVKEITEYFHGNSAKEEAHPFRIFMVVRDFLGILDRVCKEVGMTNERTIVSSAYKLPIPVNPTPPQVFSGSNLVKQCSSDEES